MNTSQLVSQIVYSQKGAVGQTNERMEENYIQTTWTDVVFARHFQAVARQAFTIKNKRMDGCWEFVFESQELRIGLLVDAPLVEKEKKR